MFSNLKISNLPKDPIKVIILNSTPQNLKNSI